MSSLPVCSQVSVFGYGADQQGNWHHYWEENRYAGAFRKTGVHSADFETQVIHQLAEEGKITLYLWHDNRTAVPRTFRLTDQLNDRQTCLQTDFQTCWLTDWLPVDLNAHLKTRQRPADHCTDFWHPGMLEGGCWAWRLTGWSWWWWEELNWASPAACRCVGPAYPLCANSANCWFKWVPSQLEQTDRLLGTLHCTYRKPSCHLRLRGLTTQVLLWAGNNHRLFFLYIFFIRFYRRYTGTTSLFLLKHFALKKKRHRGHVVTPLSCFKPFCYHL